MLQIAAHIMLYLRLWARSLESCAMQRSRPGNEESLIVELGRLLGSLHLALIHFPIVLLLAAFLLELGGHVRRDDQLSQVGRTTLIVGAVTTLFAFLCGNFAEIWAARDGVRQDTMELQPDAALALDYTFTRPGEYIRYTDGPSFGDRNQPLPIRSPSMVRLGLQHH